MIGKQSIKGTIVNYIGVVVGYINTILLFPLYFTPEEFGLTRVLLSIGVFLTQISQLGLGQVIIKFLPYFKDEPKDLSAFIKHILKLCFWGIFIIAIIVFFAGKYIINFYPTESKEYLNKYFYLAFPLTAFLTVYEIADSFLKGYFKTVFATFVKEVFIRIAVTVNIFLFYLKLIDFNAFVIIFVSVYAVSFLLLLPAIKLSVSLPSINDFTASSKIKSKLNKYMLRYGLFALLTTAGTILINNIDIVMLGYLIDLKAVAVYSVAFYIAVIIQIPQRNLSRIITPVLSESWKKKDLEKIAALYKKASIIMFFIGAYIFSIIWVNVEDMFSVMPKSEIYKQGKYVVLFIGLSKVIDMVASINTEIISVSRYYVFNFISLLLLVLLAIVTNSLLIPLYAANGAALATLISILLYSVMKLVYLKSKLNMHPFSAKELLILIVLILFVVFPEWVKLSNMHLITAIVIKSLIVSIAFAAMAYFLGIHTLIKKENLQ